MSLSRPVANGLLLLVFALSVALGIVQRWPYIGTLTEGHHQWLMAEQVKFVDYWDRDGLWADRLLTLESPRSIEALTFEDRIVYGSFPPGGTLQIYALHRLWPEVALPTLISFYGIGLQALIALGIGLLVRRMIAPDDRGGLALFFVLAAMLTYLFHPAPYYFHSMIQFGFQSTLLPFVIGLYLEHAIRGGGTRGLLWLQAAALAWMAALDWLFIPFGIALTLFRLVSPLPQQYARGRFVGLVRTALQIWLAPCLVCAAFLLNLHLNGALVDLISRAMIRTGNSTGVRATPGDVWQHFFVETLGNSWVWLLLGGLVSLALLVRDRRDPAAVVSLVALLTCLFYVALLPNDCVAHDFSALKFYVPLSLATFGIMPYRAVWLARGKPRLACFGLMAFLWAFYLIHFRSDWQDWFQDRPPATQKLAEWLRANAGFDDVFLSDSLEIADNPPVPVAIARKRVWLFATPQALDTFRRRLPDGARLRFVSRHDFDGCFVSAPPTVVSDGSRIYVAADWNEERQRCVAAHWAGRT